MPLLSPIARRGYATRTMQCEPGSWGEGEGRRTKRTRADGRTDGRTDGRGRRGGIILWHYCSHNGDRRGTKNATHSLHRAAVSRKPDLDETTRIFWGGDAVWCGASNDGRGRATRATHPSRLLRRPSTRTRNDSILPVSPSVTAPPPPPINSGCESFRRGNSDFGGGRSL